MCCILALLISACTEVAPGENTNSSDDDFGVLISESSLGGESVIDGAGYYNSSVSFRISWKKENLTVREAPASREFELNGENYILDYIGSYGCGESIESAVSGISGADYRFADCYGNGDGNVTVCYLSGTDSVCKLSHSLVSEAEIGELLENGEIISKEEAKAFAASFITKNVPDVNISDYNCEILREPADDGIQNYYSIRYYKTILGYRTDDIMLVGVNPNGTIRSFLGSKVGISQSVEITEAEIENAFNAIAEKVNAKAELEEQADKRVICMAIDGKVFARTCYTGVASEKELFAATSENFYIRIK